MRGVLVRTVQLGRFEPCVEGAIGPGRRAGIWVRGCPFRCSGCCTPEFQKFGGPEHRCGVDELIGHICDAVEAHGIEGVTFSGGEPFAQAVSLAVIAAAAQELGLSVLVWTGYTIEELRADDAPAGAAELLAFTDVLIDGRYDRDLPLATMRGSTNQRIHLLTDRYDEDDCRQCRVELRFDDAGGMTSFGILRPDTVEAVMAMFGIGLKK